MSEPVPLDLSGETDPLTLLAELGQEFAQSIDIDETLDRVVQRITDYMGAEAASVFLVEPDGRSLICRACAGPVDVRGLKLELGQGIVGRTAATSTCQLVRDARTDPDFAQRVDRRTGFETRSVLCTPLRSAEGVIGVLQVLNKRDGGLFGASDQATLRVLAAPTSLAINNARMAQELIERAQLKRELMLARRLQRSLLPAASAQTVDLVGVNLPARQVSGDFYDFYPLEDGRVAFTIADVAGKGMDAALLMARSMTLLRWLGKSGLSPDQWLLQVNEELLGSVSRGMFVCAAAGYYCPQSTRVVWANAGFQPPLLGSPDALNPGPRASAPPLGVVDLAGMQCEELTLADQTMCWYSDGVTEVRGDDGQMLGTTGLAALLEEYAQRPVRPRLGEVVRRLRRMPLVDDTTILLIERSGSLKRGAADR